MDIGAGVGTSTGMSTCTIVPVGALVWAMLWYGYMPLLTHKQDNAYNCADTSDYTYAMYK